MNRDVLPSEYSLVEIIASALEAMTPERRQWELDAVKFITPDSPMLKQLARDILVTAAFAALEQKRAMLNA